MSHTSKYGSAVKDVGSFLNVAKSLGYVCKYSSIEDVDVQQYERGMIICQLSVLIPGWKYPIAVKANGEILYDHWGSEAGTMEKLGELIQTYNVDLAMQHIPYTELSNFYSAKQTDGNVKLILEYA